MDNENETFNFSSTSTESHKPLFDQETIGEELAQPCHECGDQPVVHIGNFRDVAGHPKRIYICCPHCGNCIDGWFESKDEAIEEWNRLNMGSKPRDKSEKDRYDIIDDVMKDFKIPD